MFIRNLRTAKIILRGRENTVLTDINTALTNISIGLTDINTVLVSNTVVISL